MRLLTAVAVLYGLTLGTIVTRTLLNRQEEDRKELHDYRAIELQLKLMEVKNTVHCEGT